MSNGSAERVAAVPRRQRASTLLLLACVVCASLVGSPTGAQMMPAAIRNATVLTGDGPPMANATLIWQNGKITAVGAGVSPPLLGRTIDGTGHYVTPGLIDVHTTLGLRDELGGGRPIAKAIDAFDRYATDDLSAALRQGVTTVYVPARTGSGFGGLGAILRLEGKADELVLDDEAALCAAVDAAGRAGPLQRVKVAEDLGRRFRAARDYRTAWEDYEEELKEYEKKLAERAKKETREEKKNGAKKKAAAEEDKKKPAKKKNGKPDEKKKEDELKKPAEPDKNRGAEVLLRALDGELRLRVEAHEPADILNILELADEYHVALILEGATAAHLVADQIAAHDVPVVLSSSLAAVAYDPGAERFDRPDAAAILQRAGVSVYFGSGEVPPGATPNLTLRVARATGHGFGGDAALRSITFGAATLLGIDDKVGTLRAGRQADLVLWSGHPLTPGSRVERVYIAGREVYRAKDE